MAEALNDAGYWACIYDCSFCAVYATDEWRKTTAGLDGLANVVTGHFAWGPEVTASPQMSPTLATSIDDLNREAFSFMFPEILISQGGDRSRLREIVDPLFLDLVDTLPAADATPAASEQQRFASTWGIDLGTWTTRLRVHDTDGRHAGYALMAKPAAGMALLGTIAGGRDTRHLERSQEVVTASRRSAAILFADLEASSVLSRRLSTSDYFKLARRLVRVADQCVVDAGGLVGRHLGDGVTAFFLADSLGSESAAARACIEATRSLRDEMHHVAERSSLAVDDLTVRFGLHWGATLYVGLIKSIARSEVTALGDEVNETARIEACASGGRSLASKALIERLNDQDARDLDLTHVSYTPLGELTTATDKAKRDAPNIAVCAL